MSRLYRPSIPVEIKCRVALRQLGEMWIDSVIELHRPRRNGDPPSNLTSLLQVTTLRLSCLLGCPVSDLRLDHNPALENRIKRTVHRAIRGKVREIMIYSPDANDPEYLIYRTAHDHHIKTNVRGDGAQFSDTALAKRERKRKKKQAKKRRHPWPKGRKIQNRKRNRTCGRLGQDT